MGSLSHKFSQPDLSSPSSPVNGRSRQPSYFSTEGMISPMEERGDFDFHLDMNLDDMEGIVDPTMASGPPQPPPTASSVSTSNFSSLGLQDANRDPGSMATTISRDESSGGSAGSVGPGRQIIGDAERGQGQFQKVNPFSNSPTGSIDRGIITPSSPQNLSPKNMVHNHPNLMNQPRRPSQLRNMKIGSMDSEISATTRSSDGQIQPLAPAWAQTLDSSNGHQNGGETVFNDPFGNASRIGRAASISTKNSGSQYGTPQPGSEGGSQFDNNGNNRHLAPAIAAPLVQDAWAAPESWGVEGDDLPPDEADSSSSEAEEEGWAGDEALSDKEHGGTRKKGAPTFGHGSRGSARGRGRGSNARPGTSGARPSTVAKIQARPGTSGSVHVANVPVSLCPQ